MAISLEPPESSHSCVQVKDRPCIRPSGSFFVPGACQFLSQPIAALPLSRHSFRLSLTGNPISALRLFSQSISWPSAPSFFRATSVGSSPSAAATRLKTRVMLWQLEFCSQRVATVGPLFIITDSVLP